jgi:hypothetical protein
LKALPKNLWFSRTFFYQFCIISGCIITLYDTYPILKHLVFSETFQNKIQNFLN